MGDNGSVGGSGGGEGGAAGKRLSWALSGWWLSQSTGPQLPHLSCTTSICKCLGGQDGQRRALLVACVCVSVSGPDACTVCPLYGCTGCTRCPPPGTCAAQRRCLGERTSDRARIYMSACGLLCSWGCRLLPVAGISALRPLRAVRLWTATSEPRIPHPQRGDDSDARPVWAQRT